MPGPVKPRIKTARQGPRLYLDILRLVKYGYAHTSLTIAQKQGITGTTAFRIATGMWGCGLIHPQGWELHGSHWVAVWQSGPGEAAPHPVRGIVKAPRCTRIELLAFAHLWAELQEPSTKQDLVDASGYTEGTVRMLVEHARARRMVRISEWLVNMGSGGDHTPLYQHGSKADEPKPQRQDKALLDRQYWERRRERIQNTRLIAATTGAAA